jgi:hypothetical protein
MQTSTGNTVPQDLNTAGRNTVNRKQVQDIFRKNRASCLVDILRKSRS